MHGIFGKAGAFICAMGFATPPVLTAHPDEPVAATSVEVEISGPRLIKRGDTLHFCAFLTNRSPETVIVLAADPNPQEKIEPEGVDRPWRRFLRVVHCGGTPTP
jgi:hypothetical protein